jgi:hypothetical protein
MNFRRWHRGRRVCDYICSITREATLDKVERDSRVIRRYGGTGNQEVKDEGF